MAGREWAINTGFTAKAMCEYFETAVDTCFETWTPRQKFDLINTNRPTPDYPDGILFNKIEEGETI